MWLERQNRITSTEIRGTLNVSNMSKRELALVQLAWWTDGGYNANAPRGVASSSSVSIASSWYFLFLCVYKESSSYALSHEIDPKKDRMLEGEIQT